MDLSRRLSSIAPSGTIAAQTRALQLKAEGKPILSFGAGEPDFATPTHILEAAITALHKGATKYTATAGIPELRAAIITKLKRDNNLTYTPEEVIASCGAKHSLYACFQAILNPGDEVILAAPYWVSYVEMIKLAEGVPVVIDTTGTKFALTAAMVKEKITPKTKAIIICNPSNPTGAVVSDAETQKIVALAIAHDFFVISDEVYEAFTYEQARSASANEPTEKNRPRSAASYSKEAWEHTITINSVSKTYAMTGWRLGYAAGPKSVITLMNRLQDHLTSNPAAVTQHAAIAALTGPQECVAEMYAEYRARRTLITDGLCKIPGVRLDPPAGAFYVFPEVSALYKKLGVQNSWECANALLEKANIAVVAGAAFGKESDGFIRFSYATSRAVIQEGLARLHTLFLE